MNFFPFEKISIGSAVINDQSEFGLIFGHNGFVSSPDFANIVKSKLAEITFKKRNFIFFGRFRELPIKKLFRLAVPADESQKFAHF